MPRARGIPAYRHHKARGLAKVRLDGRDVYLGEYDSPESRKEYDRVIAEYLIARAAPPSAESAESLSVSRLVAKFWIHAQGYYKGKGGKPTDEVKNLRDALRPVVHLYGETLVRDFGPLALEAVRADMIRSGLARTTINARVHRIRRAFRWGVSRELVPPAVVGALDSVAALAKNRSAAPEPPPVRPVPPGVVEATLPHLPAPVAAMVRLQLLTGMRAGEVMAMRGSDLHPGDPTWEYRPADHKGSWRDGDRAIQLGPRARAIVAAFLKPDLAAHLFDPRDAVAGHHAARGAARKSRPTPSERARKKARPGEARCERYDRRTYRQAIVRACDRAFPHPTISLIPTKRLTAEQRAELAAWRKGHRWCPLQLRHSAGTLIRKAYGLEVAQVVLGHAKADVTQLYAERDTAKARAAMAEIG